MFGVCPNLYLRASFQLHHQMRTKKKGASSGNQQKGSVVFSARRLRHYFHSFTILVMSDLPIQKVLKKPDVAGRMVKWAVDLSEFDIKYEPRGQSRGKSLQISWSSSRLRRHELRGTVSVGYSR